MVKSVQNLNSQRTRLKIGNKLTDILEILICLILFLTGVYKGGFYKADFLFPNVVVLLIGVVYLAYKMICEIRYNNDRTRPSAVRIALDVFVLLFPITYFLPIVFGKAVSISDSIYEGLRYVNFAIIYYIVRKSSNLKKFENILIVLGIMQAIFGIDQLTYRDFEPFLDSISTGYLSDKERLSGTIQYANVTGLLLNISLVFILNKMHEFVDKVKDWEKIETDKSKRKFIRKIIYTFIFVFIAQLLITCNIFTESRVSMCLMIISVLVISIFNFIKQNKKIAIITLLTFFLGIVASSNCEHHILDNKYCYIYVSIAIFSVIVVVLQMLIDFAISKVNKEARNIEENGNSSRSKKEEYRGNIINSKRAVICFCILIILVITGTPSKLRVMEGTAVTRYSYDFKNGKNTLYIDLKCLEEDTRYKVEIYGIKDDFQEEYLGEANYYDKTTSVHNMRIDISGNTEKLKIYIKVIKGGLKVNKFSINGKNQALSYMFMPDEIIFKLKDTNHKVYGDVLRLEYAKDSFKIFKQSPLFGFGGEAFKYKYGEVQERYYISTETHSAFLQSLVEVGIMGTSIFVSIILVTAIATFRLFIDAWKNNKSNIYLYITYVSFLIMSMFDLVFSYALGIYLFGIFAALVTNKYMEKYIDEEEERTERLKRDQKWYNKIEDGILKITNSSYVRIMFLSLALVLSLGATYIGINAYKASIVKIPHKEGRLSAGELEENIAYLEIKLKQDRFDMKYRELLNEQYINYISVLKDAYISGNYDKRERKTIKEMTDKAVISLKENSDEMINYCYHDKYILEEVSSIYLNNFTTFEKIYNKQFKDTETAYAFYLGYVIKLTDRILEINPKSYKAQDMVKKMYTEYIETLESQNSYLGSQQVQIKIGEMKSRIN